VVRVGLGLWLGVRRRLSRADDLDGIFQDVRVDVRG